MAGDASDDSHLSFPPAPIVEGLTSPARPSVREQPSQSPARMERRKGQPKRTVSEDHSEETGSSSRRGQSSSNDKDGTGSGSTGSGSTGSGSTTRQQQAKRRKTGSKAPTLRPRKQNIKWEAPFVYTDEKSPLAAASAASLRDILLLPQAWEILTAEEKKEILAHFPDDTHILDPGTENARPNIESLRNDDDFRVDCARYTENIKDGKHDEEWLRQAWEAHEKHKSGQFDEYLRNEFEKKYGEKIPKSMLGSPWDSSSKDEAAGSSSSGLPLSMSRRTVISLLSDTPPSHQTQGTGDSPELPPYPPRKGSLSLSHVNPSDDASHSLEATGGSHRPVSPDHPIESADDPPSSTQQRLQQEYQEGRISKIQFNSSNDAIATVVLKSSSRDGTPHSETFEVMKVDLVKALNAASYGRSAPQLTHTTELQATEVTSPQTTAGQTTESPDARENSRSNYGATRYRDNGTQTTAAVRDNGTQTTAALRDNGAQTTAPQDTGSTGTIAVRPLTAAENAAKRNAVHPPERLGFKTEANAKAKTQPKSVPEPS
ncbi:Asx homology domain containing protein [Rhypophila sp. PSN 637]